MHSKNINNKSITSFNADALLREHGIYPTSQRLIIADTLLSRPQHLTAEQVCHSVARVSEQIKVSQATVYNTLGLFVARGLLKEIHVDSAKTFYDTNTRPHQHFYNIDTNEISDIEKPLEFSITDNDLPPSTKIDSINTVVRIRNHSV